MKPSIPIHHDPDKGMFSMAEDDEIAYVHYHTDRDVLHIRSTYVAPKLRGRDLGRQLVAAAVAFADEHQLRVETSCWYAAKILGESPA